MYFLWAFTRQVIPIIFYTLKQNDYPLNDFRQSLCSPFLALSIYLSYVSYQCLSKCKLSLIPVTSIHSIQRKTKKARNLGARRKLSENSRLEGGRNQVW